MTRDFVASGPNQKGVTEITHLPCTDGWLDLANGMDLYLRNIVGWAMQNRLEPVLVTAASQMALSRRHPGAGLLPHSDGGSRYASVVYQQAW